MAHRRTLLLPASLLGALLGAGILVGACDDGTATGGAGGTGTTSSSTSKTGSTSSSASSMTTGSTATGATSSATGGTGTTSSSTGGQNCVTLDPGTLLQFGMDGEILYSTPTLADAAKPDDFNIYFYGMPYTPATGTYDLASTGVNDNYATCAECVYLFQDVDMNDVEDKAFFQSEGTLTITATDPTLPNVSEGSLTNVKLVEVTIDENFFSTPVPGGDCYVIPSLAWDTMP